MSSRYIEGAVEDMRADPRKNRMVTLLLGVDSTRSTGVQERVRELGGDVVEELPFEMIEVRLPETAVADVCAMDGIESIETDESIEDLDSGNPNFPSSSTR